MSSFEWTPGEPPPEIEEHSKAKLDVLRHYLRAYFDTLNVNPKREEFKIDLVDGFAGGGIFRDGSQIISGTPLIMLEECETASERLNLKRTKKLHFDYKCYFVDKEKAHTDHLKKAIKEHRYDVGGDKIVVRNNLFEKEIDNIIKEIQRRQPKAGRAIFLLDQTGFSQVELKLVSRIFDELPKAEVILTFAADVLLNHLSQNESIVKAAAPIELKRQTIRDMLEEKGEGGRFLAQRTLRKHIHNVINRYGTSSHILFDTPFFVRPRKSRRALWFIHLSRHLTARDVMLEIHWKIQNTFEHYGHGGFGMMGWDPIFGSEKLQLFNFKEKDAKEMREQLLNSMLNELYGLIADRPINMDVILHMFANSTAATISDFNKVFTRLYEEKEIKIISEDGKERSRSLKHVSYDDLIALPDTLLIPGISRHKH